MFVDTRDVFAMVLPRLLCEPLLHFFVLGLGVWLLDLAGNDETHEVVVQEREIVRMAALWEREWQRPPTPEELQQLIADRVREEILYREALRLRLDEGDTVIRRRLAQKMAFVSEDRVVLAEPPEAELRAFFKASAGRYNHPARISLHQIPFKDDADEGELAAVAALERLPSSDDADLATFGEASLLPRSLVGWTVREVAAEFGDDFLAALELELTGRWQGPVRSAFGFHVVRVDSFVPAVAATFATVRSQVARDWLHSRRREARQAFYAELRARYRVHIEGGGVDHVSPEA